MPSLRILILSKNKFQGNPSSIFSNLTIIEKIDVSHNHFQGPVPFSTFANLSKLRYLDLSYNQIEVETENPSWQPSFQLEHLLLADCNLNKKSNHGIPSFISTQYTLQTLDLSSNFFAGSIPIWMLHNVSSVLRLRGNMFSGNFPQSSRNVASPLVEFDISCNYFEGPLPLNITALYPRLYRFNVSTNGLTGTLPPSLGELASLQQLDLSNNKLVGNIPSRLTENSSLWYLNLSNNRLQGELLPQDCNMRQLRWLLLRDNKFVGSMPLCLSNSPSLLILDMGKNKLSGNISNRLPTFPSLGALLLGGNQIKGSIPMQLCQMKYIQILDLSNNNFLGNIPSCLSNNLVWKKKFQSSSWVPIDFTTKGRVPFGQHLSTITEVSYIGNPNLCGEQLRKCSGEEGKVGGTDNNEDRRKEEIRHTEENGIVDEPLFFYSCVAMSYILGFWSVVAPLFISKNWRRRYYAAVDGCIDMILQKIYVIHDMLFYRN
ncbi:receptor-like protein 8 [Camellia sinensis]|uniref:receptor-like protein 8 n=1 Tax=Camellia sinensis TaxID=4442 RepID=UPI00103603DE|nr:receptor-like protein 8 [Camellia sinensis]